MVRRICDVDVAGPIDRDAIWGIERRRRRRTPIARKSYRARTGNRRDIARDRIDLTNSVTGVLSYVDIAGPIDPDPCWAVHRRRRRRTPIP